MDRGGVHVAEPRRDQRVLLFVQRAFQNEQRVLLAPRRELAHAAVPRKPPDLATCSAESQHGVSRAVACFEQPAHGGTGPRLHYSPPKRSSSARTWATRAARAGVAGVTARFRSSMCLPNISNASLCCSDDSGSRPARSSCHRSSTRPIAIRSSLASSFMPPRSLQRRRV